MPRIADLPVEFLGSFPDPSHRLTPILPEIAFLGRSNVGKSSLLNALVGRRIARTSATPGKTQFLNVFRFPTFYLLDLPGYGYAKASLEERRRLRALVHDTVVGRTDLVAVVWLLDIRRSPSPDDLAMRDLLADAKREAIVALTKADKLSRAQQRTALEERAQELELDPGDLVVTSATKGTGIDDLGELVVEVVGGAETATD